MGKGRGKGYGKGRGAKGWTSGSWEPASSWEAPGKGKGTDWSSTSEWSQGWTDDKGGHGKGKGGQQRDYITRLEGRYAFGKALLRPYADEHGSAIYASTAGSVVNVLGKDNLRQVLDWRNSELIRRPAVGVSTVSGSLRCLKSTLEACSDNEHLSNSLDKVDRLLKSRSGRAFLDACETLTKERTGTVTQEKLAEAIKCWVSFFRENKVVLASELPKIAALSSALYLGSTQALEATTMCNALTNWANKVPGTTGNQENLAQWQLQPKDVERLKAFLLGAMQQRHTEGAAWLRQNGLGGDSDDEAGAWGVPEAPRRRARSSSSPSSDSDKRRKKKEAKKAKKRAREEARSKQDKADGSGKFDAGGGVSTEEAAEDDPEEPKETPSQHTR